MGLGSASVPLNVHLGSQGDITAWLVAGPYPNEGALQRKGTGFRTDYLGGESNARPTEGLASGAYTWKLAVATGKLGLDLKATLPTKDPAIGYCYATIVSPRDQAATLLFGSDDGARVYVNGESVYAKQIVRGVRRDEEKLEIQLKQGENQLLFKVEQGDGGWGLTARIVAPNGSPIPGLVEKLEVSPEKDDLSFARGFAGKSGAIDLEAWQSYVHSQREMTRWVKNLRPYLVHADKVDQALVVTAAKFKEISTDASAATKTLREISQTLSKTYEEARAPLMKWAQKPGALETANPTKEDFVKVMPGGRYFVHGDGKPFIPIGANHNPDWTELNLSNPLHDNYNPQKTDAWFAKLKRNGVNVIRLMVETPPSGNLEETPGVYRPEHVIWLDHIVATARKYGVKLWMTPYDTFWMSLRAETCPYWAANGGPIKEPIDFLTKPEILDLQKKRIAYLIDRYGNTGTIFAWEVMNEIDIWWKASPEQIKAWLDQMVPFVRDYEMKKWGRNHLLTVSMAAPEPKGLNAESAFRRPDLDFATMHLYLGATRATKPGQAEQAGKDFAAGVIYAQRQIRDNRPVLDGESGPIDKWIDDIRLDNETFHQMSWSHLLAGGAGPGTRWPYRHPHHITDGMLATLKSMRVFSDGVDWTKLSGKLTAMSASGGTAQVLATEKGGIAWIQHLTGEAVSVAAGYPVKARLFDVRAGKWLAAQAKPGAAFQVPAGVEEVVLSFERA